MLRAAGNAAEEKNKMPEDEDRVFDVSKPHKVSPSATSRPVIVGHHPIMSDPMVTENRPDEPEPSVGKPTMTHAPISLDVPDPTGQKSKPPAQDDSKKSFFMPAASPKDEQTPETDGRRTTEIYPQHDETPDAASTVRPGSDAAGLPPVPQTPGPLSDLPLPMHHGGKLSHSGGYNKKWSRILVAIVALIVIYALLDAKTSVSLPFYVFRKTAPASQTPAVSPIAATTVPNGFKAYSLSSTAASFDYPTAWGAPAVKLDSGFSKRGGNNKSDGTYAYVVNFAINKDVQLAFTSSKYLPVTRDALYYDYLGWCTGSNDGKFYNSSLHYSTDSGVDMPTTTTCDQGPLSGVIKLNTTTLVQLNTTAADGTALGDLYTKNLADTSLPVVRAKDATMTNANLVKILLGTVKITNSSTPTNAQ